MSRYVVSAAADIECIESAVGEVPLEVAVSSGLDGAVGVDAEQLGDEQCCATPPNDSNNDSSRSDHVSKVSTERGRLREGLPQLGNRLLS